MNSTKSFENDCMPDFIETVLRCAGIRKPYSDPVYDGRRVFLRIGEDQSRHNYGIRMWSANEYFINYTLYYYPENSSGGVSIVENQLYLVPASARS